MQLSSMEKEDKARELFLVVRGHQDFGCPTVRDTSNLELYTPINRRSIKYLN